MGWESNAVFQVLIIQGSTGSGLFVYSPAPGAGNLVASITASPTGGTDNYTNVYLAGITAYSSAGTLAVQQFGGATQYYTAPSELGPWTLQGGLQALGPTGGMALTSQATGQPIELSVHGTEVAAITNTLFQILEAASITAGGLSVVGGITADTEAISSGQAAGLVLAVTDTTSAPTNPISSIVANASGDNSFGVKVAGDTSYRLRVDSTPAIKLGPGNATQDVTLTRAAANILGQAGGEAFTSIATPAALANPILYGANSGQLAQVNPQGLQGALVMAQASNASHTVTQASLTQISAQFTLPAADAGTVGTTYRLTCAGTGTWGSTVQNFTFQTLLAGSAFADGAGVNSGTFPASTAIRWKVQNEITIATTGVSGTATQTLTVWISDNAVATNVSRLVTRHSAGNAINTTVSNTLSMGAQWNSTTGAPTATCDQTLFERVV